MIALQKLSHNRIGFIKFVQLEIRTKTLCVGWSVCFEFLKSVGLKLVFCLAFVMTNLVGFVHVGGLFV